MFLIETEFVEELLKYMLSLSAGSPVMVLRDRHRIYILTELGGQPMVFTSEIPKVHGELKRIYEEFKHAKYIYIGRDGQLVLSDKPPQTAGEVMSTGVGIVLDISGLYIGEKAFERLRELVEKR